MMKAGAALLGGALSWCALGCGAVMPGAHNGTGVASPVRGRIEVGAAMADITPSAGVSTFGHGPESRAVDGYWTRLHCRAFYFAIPRQHQPPRSIAIVACDLPAISTLLQRRVAMQLEHLDLDPSRVMLTATHTHAGPAHYMDAKSYSDRLSSHLPGHDDDMVEFLAERIAGAVKAAVANKQLAKLSWARTTALWGITRNRNPGAHRRNPQSFPFATTAPAGLSDAERAIDPDIEVLRIDTASGKPIGALSFFAMHPTVLPHTNRLLGGDTHAVISRLIERELRAECGDCVPVHGIINTNEGDLVPTFARGTADEAESIATEVATGIWSAWKTAVPTDETTLASAYLETDLPCAGRFDGLGKLCKAPALGLAAPGGSREHPTWFAAVSGGTYHEGNRNLASSDCHTPKRVIGGILQRWVAGYPERVPLAVVVLQDRLIAFVPGELTLAAGLETRRAIEAAADGKRAIVAGLANGYIQYVATGAEYQAQRYEGASTLYGAHTSAVLAERFAMLTNALHGRNVARELAAIDAERDGAAPRLGETTAFEYHPGPKRDRIDLGEGSPSIAELGAARHAVGQCRVAGHPHAVCFWWKDAGPAQIHKRGNDPWIVLAAHGGDDRPVVVDLVSPITQRPVRQPLDDRGTSFFTRIHHELSDDTWMWSTVFRPSPEMAASLGAAEVRILAVGEAGGSPVSSQPFSMTTPLHGCTEAQMDLCTVLE